MNPSHTLPRKLLPKNAPRRPGAGRLAVAGTAAFVLSIVWTHALAGILRIVTPDAPLAARTLTLLAAFLVVAGLFARSAWTAGGLGVLAIAWLQAFLPGSWAVGLSLPIAAAGATGLGLWMAARLSPDLDTTFRRRPWAAAAWALMAVLAIVQIGRLSTWMTDAEYDWFGTTRHPFWAKHECMSAYLYGAELTEMGEANPWDASHYPGLNPQAAPETRIHGMVVEDPFQYTPQFLLLPKVAISLTDSYAAIKGAWFGLQTTGFLAVMLWLATWVGGRAGRTATYLMPILLLAVPTLHSLQYGQFHLAALILGIAGLLCFATGRRTWGGALLAVSILSKIFPVVLLAPLVAQRRWRDVASVAAFCIAITALSFAVFGGATFGAFFDYHLPRLGDGQAFAFGEAWPEVRELVIAANHGAYGMVTKLGEMGVPGMTEAVAATTGRVYFLGILLLAGFAGFRLRKAARRDQAITWISLIGLASMGSAGAFADYVPVAFALLLPFLAQDMARSKALAALYGVTAFFQFTLLGAAPWGDWAPTAWTMPLSAIGVALLWAGFGVAMARALASARVADRSDTADDTADDTVHPGSLTETPAAFA